MRNLALLVLAAAGLTPAACASGNEFVVTAVAMGAPAAPERESPPRCRYGGEVPCETPSADPCPAGPPGALSEAQMRKFVASALSSDPPARWVVGLGGTTEAAKPGADALAQLDRFARRHGFSGYREYLDVWARVTAARVAAGDATPFERHLVAKYRAQLDAAVERQSREPRD